jgi:outer membrane protein
MRVQTIFTSKTLALAILATSSAWSFAQSAGDTIINAGWFHISPQDSSRPLTSTSSATSFSTTLPGSGASIENMDTVGFSVTRFFTDNWAGTFDLGIPPTYKLNGTGSLASVGQIGSAKQWAPAILARYFFGDANAKIRPSLGFGVTHVNYTSIELNNQFKQTVGTFFNDPTANTTAELQSSWAPIFNAGVSYAINDRWSANLSVSYLRLRTNGTLKTYTNGDLGTITSTTSLDINPIVTYLNMGYKF